MGGEVDFVSGVVLLTDWHFFVIAIATATAHDGMDEDVLDASAVFRCASLAAARGAGRREGSNVGALVRHEVMSRQRTHKFWASIQEVANGRRCKAERWSWGWIWGHVLMRSMLCVRLMSVRLLGWYQVSVMPCAGLANLAQPVFQLMNAHSFLPQLGV
jgi:hypothetical protein